MTEPFKEGDEVRITRDLPASKNNDALSAGATLIVTDYVSAEEADDVEPGAFYWASYRGGYNNVWFPDGAAELVRSAAEMAGRKLPEPSVLAINLAGMIGEARDFDLNESDPDGETVEFYGTTAEGLPFGFRVRVESVWETDG